MQKSDAGRIFRAICQKSSGVKPSILHVFMKDIEVLPEIFWAKFLCRWPEKMYGFWLSSYRMIQLPYDYVIYTSSVQQKSQLIICLIYKILFHEMFGVTNCVHQCCKIASLLKKTPSNLFWGYLSLLYSPTVADKDCVNLNQNQLITFDSVDQIPVIFTIISKYGLLACPWPVSKGKV